MIQTTVMPRSLHLAGLPDGPLSVLAVVSIGLAANAPPRSLKRTRFVWAVVPIGMTLVSGIHPRNPRFSLPKKSFSVSMIASRKPQSRLEFFFIRIPSLARSVLLSVVFASSVSITSFAYGYCEMGL
jgi:hypothetical protein